MEHQRIKLTLPLFGDGEEFDRRLISAVRGKKGESEYATTNAEELFAEGFAAWYGGDETEFANAFGAFIKENLR